MSSFLKNLLSSPAKASIDDIQYWRNQILNAVLIAAAFLGGAAYYINLVLEIENRNWTVVVLYSIIFGWLLLITGFRRIAYNLRAGTLVTLFFAVGLISATQYASYGDVRVWWLGLSLLSAVFFGTWAGVVTSTVSTLLYLGIGWSMSQFMFVSPVLDEYLASPGMSHWTSTSIPFFTVSLLGIISFGVVINGLRNNLQKASKLTAELEEDRIGLQKRTTKLERRETQIRTAAEISRAISAELDPNTIFQQVVDLMKERLDLYYVGVFMLDDSERFAVLRVGSGEAGNKMVSEGHILTVGGNSMIGWSISNRQARIALDVGEDAVHFQNPHLPLTRSELALPMISEKRVLGALSIQSTQPKAFDQDDITVLQGIADSLTTAIENANLFNQVQDNLEEIRTLHRQYLATTWKDVIAHEGDLSYTFEDASVGGDPVPETDSNTLEVPLILRDQVIGTITIERDQEMWTLEENALVNDIATQAALALENARLVEETARGSQFNRSVTDITRKVWTSTSVDTILRTALQELGNTLGVTDGIIKLNPPQRQKEV
jgi:GAF domain-containing protein